jgi:glycine cleavage system aminomethyltransferase T
MLVGPEYVGYTTSGGYGHCAGTSLAMGYVAAAAAASGGEFSATLLGESRPARLLSQASIDERSSRSAIRELNRCAGRCSSGGGFARLPNVCGG